jgi:hypothetical protein
MSEFNQLNKARLDPGKLEIKLRDGFIEIFYLDKIMKNISEDNHLFGS